MLAALAFGDRIGAMDALERSLLAHQLPTVSGVPGCDPLLDPLHAEPHFLALMQQIGVSVCDASARRPLTAPAPASAARPIR